MARRSREAGPGRVCRESGRGGGSRERGFGVAYFLVLMAVAVLVVLTLSERSVLALRRAGQEMERTRAQYLALSAAEHAIWRLQHDDCFLESEQGTTFLDSLGAGEYAYRVTGTPTDVLVEATGTLGKASYTLERRLTRLPSAARAMLAYGHMATKRPVIREFVAAAWGPETSTQAATKSIVWTVLRGCPTRRERLLATLDKEKRLDLQVWSSDAWTDLGTLTSQTVVESRCFDLAYESLSGDALIAYRNDESGKLVHHVWDGHALGPAQILDLPLSGPIFWVALVTHARTDEIALLALGGDKKLVGAMWTGDDFVDLQLLDDRLVSVEFELAAATFLDLDRTALFAWTRNDTLYSRTWRDGWSPLLTPGLRFGRSRWMRLVARPGTTEALVASLQENRHIDALTWSGISWDPASLEQITDDAANTSRRCFDLAFSGDEVSLLVYGVRGSTTLQATAWTPVFGWVQALSGPDLEAEPRTVQLRNDPYAGLVHVVVYTKPEGSEREIHAGRWDGGWGGMTRLAKDVPESFQEGFMCAPGGAACIP